jgi:hypothetical protein
MGRSLGTPESSSLPKEKHVFTQTAKVSEVEHYTDLLGLV